MQAQQGIYARTQKVYAALTMDIAYSGITVSRSASLAAKQAFDLDVVIKNIMGVKIPQLKVSLHGDARLNTYEHSPQLVEVAQDFKQLLQDVVAFSSIEQSLLTLAEEVKKMKRRVNFLENIRIPELHKLSNDIKFVLAEQERENFARLKKLQH
jgi:H(+)-transporting ATP synthase subunit D